MLLGADGGVVQDGASQVVATFSLGENNDILCFDGAYKYRDLVFLALRENRNEALELQRN